MFRPAWDIVRLKYFLLKYKWLLFVLLHVSARVGHPQGKTHYVKSQNKEVIYVDCFNFIVIIY
jgi:hypothetical protein